MRIELSPGLLRWARERARKELRDLAKAFPHLGSWEQGLSRPTLKQLEKFARAVHVPIGFLFLPEPPVEALPIPDFRTIGSARIVRPSADLLDMIYVCQQRQEWYRDFARGMGEEPLPFVGSARVGSDVVATAASMRSALNFDLEERRQCPTWSDALRRFIGQADTLGVLVMCSGVVLSNNRRALDPEEFRGFALADTLAPLVFINGKDSRAAQMFTLAHELAHIWLGQSAVSDAEPTMTGMAENAAEQWCNRVAAEVLVPMEVFVTEYRPRADQRGELDRLARRFKVSTLVVLRRMHDAGGLTRDEFWSAYHAELQRLTSRASSGGGDFYLTQGARVSKRFARALVVSTLEGQTLYSDAFRMLGFAKLATFRELGRSLGVAA